MKRKLTAVLLCVALLLTLSFNVSADTLTDTTQPITDTQTTPITDEFTVSVGENGEVSVGNLAESGGVSRAQTSGIVNGGIYRIKNVASGKYMNVHGGIDANGTNVYQYTGNDSIQQNFRVVYSSSTDSYMIYAMCSSNGTNRVLDVTRGSNPLIRTQNIKLYSPTDPISQEIKINYLGSNKYSLVMRNNESLALTTYGTENGSATGTAETSDGNIFLENYTGAANQQWMLELVENPNASSTPIGYLDSVSSTQIGGWAYQPNIPNTVLTVHIYIINHSTSEQEIIGVYANGYRQDLFDSGYGDGYHAFHYAINWKTYLPGDYTVRAYAIGVNSDNVELTNSPRYFTVRNIQGVVEYLDNDGIGGWVWKPDAPNEAIDVHIYITKTNGTQVAVYSLNAWQPREDLAAAGYGDGEHGFSQAIDWASLPEEKLYVVVYAVDGSGYNPSFYSGYYYNGVEEPTTDYVWPTKSRRVTQTYNPILPYSEGHYGIDIGATTRHVAGDEIYCFADGYVVRNIPEWSTYGYGAYINHINPDQSISTYIQTRYAHMMSQSSVVVNTNIIKGTVIGYMGNTGASNEVHLHFETRIAPVYTSFIEDKSYCIDPLTYYGNNDYVLANSMNGGTNNDNPWGLIFDINNIETEIYLSVKNDEIVDIENDEIDER